MRYGICCGLETVPAAAEAGFDYFEGHTLAVPRPLDPEAAFEETLALVQRLPIPCEAINCFIQGGLMLTGPNASPHALRPYAQRVFDRAARAGVKVVVLGSGGARRVPEDFDHRAAWGQMVSFCAMIAPLAAAAGIVVPIEPLDECNLIGTLAPAARLVSQARHPSIRLLADSFHWARRNDSLEDLKRFAPLLGHVHVATWPSRTLPGLEECPLGTFLRTLRDAGYDGRVSIEPSGPKDPAAFPRALAALKSLAGD